MPLPSIPTPARSWEKMASRRRQPKLAAVSVTQDPSHPHFLFMGRQEWWTARAGEACYDLAMANPEERGPSHQGSYIPGRSGWRILTLPHLKRATCCLLASGEPTYSLDPNGSYLVTQEYTVLPPQKSP